MAPPSWNLQSSWGKKYFKESVVGCNGVNIGCHDSTQQKHITLSCVGLGQEREKNYLCGTQ